MSQECPQGLLGPSLLCEGPQPQDAAVMGESENAPGDPPQHWFGSLVMQVRGDKWSGRRWCQPLLQTAESHTHGHNKGLPHKKN